MLLLLLWDQHHLLLRGRPARLPLPVLQGEEKPDRKGLKLGSAPLCVNVFFSDIY